MASAALNTLLHVDFNIVAGNSSIKCCNTLSRVAIFEEIQTVSVLFKLDAVLSLGSLFLCEAAVRKLALVCSAQIFSTACLIWHTAGHSYCIWPVLQLASFLILTFCEVKMQCF